MKIEKLTECLVQRSSPLFFEQSEDANLHQFVSPARLVEFIYLFDSKVVGKNRKN